MLICPAFTLLMQQKFFTNLIYILFLNFLIKPFWIFGIDISVQNLVGAEEYGFYYSLFNFSLLFNILLDFGITNYNNRNIAQYAHMLGRYFSGILVMKFFLGLLYLTVAIVMALLLGYEGRAIYFLLFLAFNQFLLSLILYLRSNLAGLLLFRLDSTLSILDRLLMIIICGILIWGNVLSGKFKIEYFVYAQTVAYLITALIVLAIVAWKAGKPELKFKLPLFKIIIRQSFPYALLILLMAFYYRLDSVMIERLLPDGREQTGIYAQAYRLLDAANMIGFLFAGLLLPIFSRMLKDQKSVARLVRLSFNLIFIPSFSIAVIAMFYSKEIMSFLYHENIQDSGSVLVLLMFCFIAISATYIYGTLLTANGSLKELNRIALLGLLVNLVLNFILIPGMKAFGAALATLVTQIIVVVLQIVVVKYKFRFGYHSLYIFKLVVVVSLTVSTGYFLQSIDFHWLLKSLAILSVSGISVLVFGLVHISEIIGFIKGTDQSNTYF